MLEVPVELARGDGRSALPRASELSRVRGGGRWTSPEPPGRMGDRGEEHRSKAELTEAVV